MIPPSVHASISNAMNQRMERVGSDPQPRNPDPTGLAVARAVQAATERDTVILFGSRARGDHRPDSDIDLLIVCPGQPFFPDSLVRRIVQEQCAAWGMEPLSFDMVTMNRDQFTWACRAENHVAGQALREGVAMREENFDTSSLPADGFPDCWPDVKARLLATRRNLKAFNLIWETEPAEQEIFGFHAQQTVENVLKAWLSAAGLRYRTVHDLDVLINALLGHQNESATPAGKALRDLAGYIRHTGADWSPEVGNWLTSYALEYRYGSVQIPMEEWEHIEFRDRIQDAVTVFVERVHVLTGTNESNLQP